MRIQPRRLKAAFENLESNPRPLGSKPLKGDLEGYWRIRVGHLRIIYQINQSLEEVKVIKIGPRGDVY
jgi:mRNA interferase RelE/StbE